MKWVNVTRQGSNEPLTVNLEHVRYISIVQGGTAHDCRRLHFEKEHVVVVNEPVETWLQDDDV